MPVYRKNKGPAAILTAVMMVLILSAGCDRVAARIRVTDYP